MIGRVLLGLGAIGVGAVCAFYAWMLFSSARVERDRRLKLWAVAGGVVFLVFVLLSADSLLRAISG
jgi:hypothetical protein